VAPCWQTPIGWFAAFRPVLFESAETREKEATGYYNLITSSELDEDVRATLQDVFASWLEQRFSDKSKQEIEMLLLGALSDLRETRSGKDLIHIGWLEIYRPNAMVTVAH
jgi:hypothetical protein